MEMVGSTGRKKEARDRRQSWIHGGDHGGARGQREGRKRRENVTRGTGADSVTFFGDNSVGRIMQSTGVTFFYLIESTDAT